MRIEGDQLKFWLVRKRQVGQEMYRKNEAQMVRWKLVSSLRQASIEA